MLILFWSQFCHCIRIVYVLHLCFYYEQVSYFKDYVSKLREMSLSRIDKDQVPKPCKHPARAGYSVVFSEDCNAINKFRMGAAQLGHFSQIG